MEVQSRTLTDLCHCTPLISRWALGNESTQRQWLATNAWWSDVRDIPQVQGTTGREKVQLSGTELWCLLSEIVSSFSLHINCYTLSNFSKERRIGQLAIASLYLLFSPFTAAVCALREAGLQGLKKQASWTLMGPKIRLHKATIILALLHCLPACGGIAFAIFSIVLLTSFSLGRVVVVRKMSNRSWPSFVKIFVKISQW